MMPPQTSAQTKTQINAPANDLPLQRILSAPTWRARFFEAAANAAASIVKYSIEQQDAIGAALWMERLHFFRRKAAISGNSPLIESV